MNTKEKANRPLARALQAPKPQPGGPVDATDHIVADVLCVNCGAKIRGQVIHDNCYECGHPNTDSVYGDLLVYSEHTQVTHLHESASIVIYSAAFTGLLALLIMVVPMFSAESGVDAINRAFDGLKFAVMIFPLVAFVGIMVLTRHGSLEYLESKYGNLGFLTRAGTALVLGLIAVAFASRYAGEVVRLAAFIAWTLIPPIWFFRGLALLMRRVPNLKLATYANFVVAGVVLIGIGGIAVFYMQPMALKSAEWEGPVIALKAIIVLACVGWSIGAFNLLRGARSTLQVIGM